MKFVQFRNNSEEKLGVLVGEEIIDLCSGNASIPNTLIGLLHEPSILDAVKSEVGARKHTIPLKDVKLLSPVTEPSKVACVGLNYVDHCEEANMPIPEQPMFFSKFPSAVIGPNDDIVQPSISEALDWEVELAIVIGKRGKNIPRSEAMDYIFGYTVAHDVSARDWQTKNGGQWLLAKTMDCFCPLGPSVVTRDEISDPHNLKIQSRVNGVLKQNSTTAKIIHKVDAVVAYLSRFCTLHPGDVILTGTPPGVGFSRKPPEYLKVGDIVECEIEGIGTLRNTVVLGE